MEPGGTVAVVGAGLMGHALALVHAAGGCPVRMQDIDPAQLDRAKGLIEAALATLIGAGVHGEDERDAILGRISAAETIAEAVRDADLVVEAVVENRDVKRAVFAEIVFARPGVGRLIFDAVSTRNYPVVMGAVLITTVLFVVSTTLSDLINALVDPRLRSEE